MTTSLHLPQQLATSMKMSFPQSVNVLLGVNALLSANTLLSICLRLMSALQSMSVRLNVHLLLPLLRLVGMWCVSVHVSSSLSLSSPSFPSFLSSPSSPFYVSSLHARLHSPLSHLLSRHQLYQETTHQLDAQDIHQRHHQVGLSRDHAHPEERSGHAHSLEVLATSMRLVGRPGCMLLQQR